MEYAVRTEGLRFLYPGAPGESLTGADLAIATGEFVAIIGNNGCGKTTLCKALNGLVPHFHRGDMAGTVEVRGMNTTEQSVASLAFEVGYVYQDFENQLLRPRVRDDVSFAPMNFGLDDYKERAERAIEIMELEEIRDRFIWELSGGQKHMVALAGVLSLDPSIIVVDEPIAQLDPVNARHVYERLRTLNQEHGKTIIVIEHHTEFVGEYCSSVVLMDAGAVRWNLPTGEALSRTKELREHDIFPPQVTQVAARLLDGPLPVTVGETVTALKRSGLAVPARGSVAGASAAAGPGNPTAAAQAPARPSDEHADAPIVVAFDTVGHEYPMLDRSSKRVLEDVTVSFREGERIALVGSNGAGKSTLMRLIAGLMRPTYGEVQVAGISTAKSLAEELANTVSFVFQNPQEMFIDDSVTGDVSYYPRAVGLDDAEQMIEFVMKRFRLAELARRDARLLSGGQQRRVSLAIGAVARPTVLMLDEPTSSLDVANRRDVLAMLQDLSAWVKTTVIATHDMELVAEWASRCIVLEYGRVVADAPPREIFGSEALVERARLRLPQVTTLSHAVDMEPVALTVEEFCATVKRATDQRAS